MSAPILLRPPTLDHSTPPSSTFTPPPTTFLAGTWRVTSSTLPMWKSARNVTITYEPLPQSVNGQPQLADTVAYQPLTGDKHKSVLGVDTYSADGSGAWDWRGKGWLKIASSHWEVLGWGEPEEGGWMVIYFAKSIFSPAGIDVLERGEVKEGVRRGIREALGGLGDEEVRALVGEMEEVKRD